MNFLPKGVEIGGTVLGTQWHIPMTHIVNVHNGKPNCKYAYSISNCQCM